MKNFDKKKLISYVYIAGFMLLITIPLLLINRDEDAISEKEMRPLAKWPPILSVEDNQTIINPNLFSRIDDYIDDRIGFRNQLILINGKLQFYCFKRLENPERYRLGPNGESNILERDVVATFQHKNLFSDEELYQLADSFSTINTYLNNHGCKYFLFTCYDKESIYPEYFPDSVLQYGDTSKTDQFMDTLMSQTDVHVIDLKPSFLKLRDQYELYAPFGDAVHWTPRGAYEGYREVMEEINSECDADYMILSPDDFDIEITDQGYSFFGGLSHSNYSEQFTLIKHDAKLIENIEDYYKIPEKDKSDWLAYYRNESAANSTKLLIFGNSYIESYIRDYFPESFSEVIFVKSYTAIEDTLPEWIESYKPNIVLSQVAERYADYNAMKLNSQTLLTIDH